MESKDRSYFRKVLTKRISTDELKSICFDLSIDYEHLHGDSHNSKVIALLEHLERRRRTEELASWIQKHRPDIWPDSKTVWLYPLLIIIGLVSIATFIYFSTQAFNSSEIEDTFPVQLIVRDISTGEFIEGVQVRLLTNDNEVPQVMYTDANGLVIFSIGIQLTGEIARVQTTHENYEVKETTLQLEQDGFPGDIRLTSK